MKKTIGALALLLVSCTLIAQSKKNYDSLAIIIVDRMSHVIGDLASSSFKLNVASDMEVPSKELIKYFSDFEIFMDGPDKMLVNARGHKGHRQFLYNGEQVADYTYDENNYGIEAAPNKILNMIDSINHAYGVDFAAEDFFYPAFTDDLGRNRNGSALDFNN